MIDAFELPKLLILKIGLLVAVILLAAGGSVDGRPLRSIPALATVGFLAAVLLATALSVAPAVSLFGAYLSGQGAITALIQGAYFLVAAVALRDESTLRRFALGLAIGAAVSAAYGIAQQIGIDPLGWSPIDDRRRAIGAFGQPDSLGEFLALSLPLTAWLAWRGRGLQRDAALWLGLIALAGLAITQARAALAAIALPAIVLALVVPALRRGRSARGIRLLIGAPPALAALFCLALLLAPSLAATVDGLVGRGEPLQRRAELWRSAVALTADRPLTGWGPDAFRYAYPAHRSPALDSLENVVLRPDTAHNLALGLAAGVGAIGLAAWLVWLAAIFRWGAAAATDPHPDPADRGFPPTLALLSVVGIYLVVTAFGRPQVTADWVAWVAAGAILGLSCRTSGRLPLPRRPLRILIVPTALIAAEGVAAVLADASYAAAIAARRLDSPEATIDQAAGSVARRPFEPVYRQFLGLALEEQARAIGDPAIRQQAVAHLGTARDLTGGRDAELAIRLARARSISSGADRATTPSPWEEIDRAIAIDPENPLVRLAAADLALDLGRPDLADRYWEAARERSRSSDAFRHLGRTALRRGDPAGARAAFAAAIKPWWPDPTKIEYFRFWAREALQAGLPDEAAHAYAQALTVDQGDNSARLDRAEALIAGRRPEEALSEVRRVLNDLPNDARALELYARLTSPG